MVMIIMLMTLVLMIGSCCVDNCCVNDCCEEATVVLMTVLLTTGICCGERPAAFSSLLKDADPQGLNVLFNYHQAEMKVRRKSTINYVN